MSPASPRALSCAALALCLAAAARAEKPARLKVAVLEYRAGVQAAARLGDRLAALLRKNAALTVIDPQEARRRLAKVDSEVARCGGENACLAPLGAELGVDEILLVGVSQLGDVVLALQRIEVARGQVVGPQISETLSAGQDPDEAAMLGWLKQLYPAEVFKRYGFINVVASLEGAEVTINGQARGETPLDGPVKVIAPRTYRVGLAKSGFVPFNASIDVLPDATVEVRAELSARTRELPWYKRWYLWAIVGGVVAASAMGTVIYLTRPDDMHVTGFIMR